VPMWVMSASVTASIAMLIPTIATMVNFGGTALGTQGVMKRDISYRFSILAYLSYVGTSLWGCALAIMGLNAKLHFTSTTIAHVHLGFVGFGLAGLVGFVYFYLERSLKLGYSRTLAEWHFWLTTIGIVGYIVSMGWLGWLEGSDWAAGGSVQGVLGLRYWYNVARAGSGGLLLIGQLILVWNIWKTMTSPPSDGNGLDDLESVSLNEGVAR
jgi:cytochrome c oxidase cbb3-type subunit 1